MVDEYLKEGASYERILREYKTHGKLYVGFDFDSTVHDYHNKGESYEQVRQLLRDLKSIGCELVCWTAYRDLNYVIEFLDRHNIPYDGVNSDGIPLPWESRKPFFSVLLDDRAGLKQVYEELIKLVKEVTNE